MYFIRTYKIYFKSSFSFTSVSENWHQFNIHNGGWRQFILIFFWQITAATRLSFSAMCKKHDTVKKTISSGSWPGSVSNQWSPPAWTEQGRPALWIWTSVTTERWIFSEVAHGVACLRNSGFKSAFVRRQHLSWTVECFVGIVFESMLREFASEELFYVDGSTTFVMFFIVYV